MGEARRGVASALGSYGRRSGGEVSFASAGHGQGIEGRRWAPVKLGPAASGLGRVPLGSVVHGRGAVRLCVVMAW
jgi:hypothetical protein